eukprot:9163125-Pyramimonas_sp.AAC.1
MPPGSRHLDQFQSLAELRRHIRDVHAPPPPDLVSTPSGMDLATRAMSQGAEERASALRSRSGDRGRGARRGPR